MRSHRLLSTTHRFPQSGARPHATTSLLFRERPSPQTDPLIPTPKTIPPPIAEAATHVEPTSTRSSDFHTELEQAKLDAMKELAYGASHEINNPLANIAARAQTLIKRETDEDKLKMLRAIHRQAMRAHEMIADLMLFARPPKLERAEFSAGDLLQQIAAEYREEADQRSMTIDIRGDSPTINADRTQLGVAIAALVRNAFESIGENGRVTLRAGRNAEGAGVIEVSDDGPGVPAEVRPHLFDPFFSGREAGRGLGFGLSKCWRIVSDHGGEVTVESPPTGGAVFRITLS